MAKSSCPSRSSAAWTAFWKRPKKLYWLRISPSTKRGINPEPFFLREAKNSFYNTAPMDMKTLMGDQDHIKENLYAYIQSFSASVRDIFERFDFHADRPPRQVWHALPR